MGAKQSNWLNKFSRHLVLGLMLLLVLQVIDFAVLKYLPHTINPKLIFGIFANNIIASIISAVVFVIIIILARKYFSLGLILLSVGLASNIIDRMAYGGVIDYFSLWMIPTFNIADILIIAGVILIGLKILRST